MSSHLFVQRLRLLASRVVPHYSRQGGYASRISVMGATAAVGGILVVTTSASLFVANYEYCSCQQEVESSERTFQVKKVYRIKKVLGEGAFAKVYKATRISDGVVVALKAINNNSTDNSDFQREIHALKLLSNPGHPHVCRLYSQHEDRNYYYLEMEMIEGGELFEHLIVKGPFSERDASRFVKQHAQALSYIHSKGLVHADLKPENLMMDSWDESKATLKVVDFGSACTAGDKKNGLNGLTIAYVPPEIFEKDAKVTAAGDMFATGLIIYCLLTGTHPFDPTGNASDKQIVQAIQSLIKEGSLEKLAFDERVAKLSPSCIDLIRRLLHPNPRLRMTSTEFLVHPWVQGSTASISVIPESDIRLKRFWQRRFRGAILNIYAKELDGDGTLSDANLRHIFEAIDIDGNGELDPSEVKAALSEILGETNMDDIFQSVDEDNSGAIDFEEFSTIMRSKFDVGAGVPINQTRRFKSFIVQKYAANKDNVSEEDLKKIFQSIDLDGDGVLQVKELLAILREMRDVDEDEISEWLDTVDSDLSGGVDFEEFKKALQQESA